MTPASDDDRTWASLDDREFSPLEATDERLARRVKDAFVSAFTERADDWELAGAPGAEALREGVYVLAASTVAIRIGFGDHSITGRWDGTEEVALGHVRNAVDAISDDWP